MNGLRGRSAGNEMPDDATIKMLKAAAATFGPASDPRSAENVNDEDFQAGYAVGRRNEDIPLLNARHPIWIEAQRRGFTPTQMDRSFDRWKQGYWFARYVAFMQQILNTEDPEYEAFKRQLQNP